MRRAQIAFTTLSLLLCGAPASARAADESSGISEDPAIEQGFGGRDGTGGPVELILIRPLNGVPYISLARVGAYGTCSNDPTGKPQRMALFQQGHRAWRLRSDGSFGGTSGDYKVPLGSELSENPASMTLSGRVTAHRITGSVSFRISDSSSKPSPKTCAASTQSFTARLKAARKIFVPAGG